MLVRWADLNDWIYSWEMSCYRSMPFEAADDVAKEMGSSSDQRQTYCHPVFLSPFLDSSVRPSIALCMLKDSRVSDVER